MFIPMPFTLRTKREILQEVCYNGVFIFVKVFHGRKRKHFEKFWNDNFNLTQTYPCVESIYNNPPDFDVYVAGSDQIWNPTCIKGDGVFLLDFVTNGKRRISYASSFAQAKLEEKFRKDMADSLRGFFSIAVRESNGVKL